MSEDKRKGRTLARGRRGLSKAKTPMSFTVRMTEEDFEALRTMADANLRSASQQAAWIIIQALRGAQGGEA